MKVRIFCLAFCVVTGAGSLLAEDVPVERYFAQAPPVAPQWRHYQLNPWSFKESLEQYRQHEERLGRKVPKDQKISPMQFLLYNPAEQGYQPNEGEQKYPLIMFLHGVGEKPPLDRLFRHTHLFDLVITKKFQQQHPCFVYVPQDNTDWQLGTNEKGACPALARAIRCLDRLGKVYPIDKSRMYVTGLSSGGFGAFWAAARYPDKFAAIFPAATTFYISHFKAGDRLTPVWLTYNVHDRGIHPASVRLQLDYKRRGGTLLRTSYQSYGHGSWMISFRDKRIYDWVFRQRLGVDKADWLSGQIEVETSMKFHGQPAHLADGLASTANRLMAPIKAGDHVTVYLNDYELVPELNLRLDQELMKGCSLYYSLDGQILEKIERVTWQSIGQLAYVIPAKSQVVRLEVNPDRKPFGQDRIIHDFLLDPLTELQKQQVDAMRARENDGVRFELDSNNEIGWVRFEGADWNPKWNEITKGLTAVNTMALAMLEKGELTDQNLDAVRQLRTVERLRIFQQQPFKCWKKLAELQQLGTLILDVPGDPTDYSFTKIPALRQIMLLDLVEINDANLEKFVGPHLAELSLPGNKPKITRAAHNAIRKKYPKLRFHVKAFLEQ